MGHEMGGFCFGSMIVFLFEVPAMFEFEWTIDECEAWGRAVAQEWRVCCHSLHWMINKQGSWISPCFCT
jgi:hypothetical protein